MNNILDQLETLKKTFIDLHAIASDKSMSEEKLREYVAQISDASIKTVDEITNSHQSFISTLKIELVRQFVARMNL